MAEILKYTSQDFGSMRLKTVFSEEEMKTTFQRIKEKGDTETLRNIYL